MPELQKVFYCSADFPYLEWIFAPGMLFSSFEKWWDPGSLRSSAHEGIDMLACSGREGNILEVNENTEVPVIYDGQIIKVLSDFLGTSVFVMHNIYDECNRGLCTVYGHIDQGEDVLEGEFVKSGDVLGRIAAVKKRGNTVPPHLHITVAWIPATLLFSGLNWQMIGGCKDIILLDPLRILTCRYKIIPDV
jgi:murein DD-endopeptidase MepM/ murein hydrolase activator NlpD